MATPVTIDLVHPDLMPLPDPTPEGLTRAGELTVEADALANNDETRDAVRGLVRGLYAIIEPHLLDRAGVGPGDGIPILGIAATQGYGFAMLDDARGTPDSHVSDEVWGAVSWYGVSGVPDDLPPFLGMWASIAVRMGYYVGRMGDGDLPALLSLAHAAVEDD